MAMAVKQEIVNSFMRSCHKQGLRWAVSRQICLTLFCLTLLFVGSFVEAGSYSLPGNGNSLVGGIQSVELQAGETLFDIARRFDLGFNEITAANPGVDPWLPVQGERIVLPTWYILPPRPWEGIVVNLTEMRLYYFPKSANGKVERVITHPLGIGRNIGPTPVGNFHILMKLEHPSWTMPDSAYAEALASGIQSPRRLVPPGPDNPLGEFAMMLNDDGLFMHGTNTPFSIGMRVSRGCLRLYPEDIQTLAVSVPKGTAVRIVEQAYKFGKQNGVLFMEAHVLEKQENLSRGLNLTPVVAGMVKAGAGRLSTSQWEQLMALARRHTGIPVAIANTTMASLHIAD